MFLGDGNHALQNIRAAKFRRGHVRQRQRRVLVKLHVRSRIIAAVKIFRADTGAMRFVGINEDEQRIHAGTFPHVGEHRVKIALHERRDADGDGNGGG